MPGVASPGLRLALAAGAAILAVAVVVAVLSGGSSGPPPLPLPGLGRPARSGDPFAYSASRESQFVSRATAGSGQVLFVKSPGGAVATAARVAAFRPLIDAATAGTSIDPAVLEGIVFLESAGQPDAIAGTDPANASGLTQILAQTGQDLLGMHVDLGRSRQITRALATAYALGESARAAHLRTLRARVDDRFDPRKALAGAVRYLELARRRFGDRSDLAVVSYHMGIGNLEQVLGDYDAGVPVPYAQLYFDTAPDRHTAAYNLLAAFSDDSRSYYWRVLAAEQIMRLYRSDRAALSRLAGLETAWPSTAEVLHPPDRTPSFSSPGAIRDAYASRLLLALPSNPAKLGLAYSSSLGALARRVGQPAAVYRGLRPAALDLLIELAARIKALSRTRAPLILADAVTDTQYQRELGYDDPPATTGYTFEILRRYASHAQAEAFQALLDRLQALNLIGWIREPGVIEITVASDAGQLIAGGV